jgi:seryl-tRNA synthetase
MSTDLLAAQRAYRDELVRHGLLIPSGVPGLYGRNGVFEGVIEQVEHYVTRLGAPDHADVMRFPPILSRTHFERSDYLKSFPQLAGIVHSFDGSDKDHAELLRQLEHGEDWSRGLPKTDVVLTPAACYPIYPTLTGTLPPDGRIIDVQSFCFRHEPSDDPARMQSFRQREHVRIADPARVVAWRDVWFERAKTFVASVQLDARPEVANDPFFGRGGKMLAINQRDQHLKFEMVVPITSTEKPTAIISLNYHQDHFGDVFGIRTADGAVAHTSCIGFGLERIALALFKTHGFAPAAWPAGVRDTLRL